MATLPSGDTSQSILIVDAMEGNRKSLRAMLRASRYRILECREAREALDVLSEERVDLIIASASLPGMSGLELCRWLKANRHTQLTPVLVLTNVRDSANELEAIASGADELLSRPLNSELVRARVASMLRTKSMTDSLEKAESILFALAQAVEQRDHYTGEHCHRMAVYSVALGKAAGVTPADRLALYRGGYLHDIGKISIPDNVLFKPGPLSPQEWVVMKRHTIKGEEICRPMKSLASVLPIIRHHHERWDGTGYPDGLRGEEIPVLARILQVCDVYDALTSARCYKAAMTHDEAAEVLKEESRRGWRDPAMVELFLDTCRHSFPGIMVPAVRELSGMLSMHHSISDVGFEVAV